MNQRPVSRIMGPVRALLTLSLLLALPLAACGPDGWTPDRGIVRRRLEIKARGLDVVPVTIVAPDGGQGPSVADRSGLVLLPGGLVEPARYLWLADALAREGHVVAVPEFPLQLGFFTVDNAHVARRVLVEGDPASHTPALVRPERVGIAGHSLGGVVAASAAVDGAFQELVLLASYAAGGDPVETLPIPVLSIGGAHDCNSTPAAVREGFARFPADLARLAFVNGLTHYGFTDALTEDLNAGCASSVGLAEGHRKIAALVHAHMAATLDGDPTALEALRRAPDGITWEDGK